MHNACYLYVSSIRKLQVIFVKLINVRINSEIKKAKDTNYDESK